MIQNYFEALIRIVCGIHSVDNYFKPNVTVIIIVSFNGKHIVSKVRRVTNISTALGACSHWVSTFPMGDY